MDRFTLSVDLVIFDFDGVIVDSEILFNEILANEISQLGWKLSKEDCLSQFTGISAKAVDKMIEEKLSHPLPDNFREIINKKIYEELPLKLKPIKSIEKVLERACCKCIASSAEMRRILLFLHSTGLTKYFRETEIFSSEMVLKGKPNPDLFLLAAEKMCVPPHRCLVIEDSVAGIQAAKLANMKVVGFVGGTHANEESYIKRIREMSPLLVTNDINEIIKYIK